MWMPFYVLQTFGEVFPHTGPCTCPDHLQNPFQFGRYIKSMLRNSFDPTKYPIFLLFICILFALICMQHQESVFLLSCFAPFSGLISPLNDMDEERVPWTMSHLCDPITWHRACDIVYVL